MRNLVYDQYRVAAAQNFMMHSSIIGFCKPTEDTTYDALVSTMDGRIERLSSFRISPERVAALDNGLGQVFAHRRNPELYGLQNACLKAAKRHIARDARMPRTVGADEDFQGHMTVCILDASRRTLLEMGRDGTGRLRSDNSDLAFSHL